MDRRAFLGSALAGAAFVTVMPKGTLAAGFEVTRTPGFGRKRHMTRGVLK